MAKPRIALCVIEECGRVVKARGWCARHYTQWQRTGSPLARTATDRFMAKVQMQPDTGCWLWAAHKDMGGYGEFSVGGRARPAHRFAYETWGGHIPEGMVLDHFACNTRHCVSPLHVRPVTPRENALRCDSLGSLNLAKTDCSKGHPFDEANTYYYRGDRYCRACLRAKYHARKARKAAQVLA